MSGLVGPILVDCLVLNIIVFLISQFKMQLFFVSKRPILKIISKPEHKIHFF